ncbi:hypothetical protein ES703_61953 [subsurface metagenome]
MIQPEVFDEIELLRRYKAQKTYSDSQLGVEMREIDGDMWTPGYLAKIFAGRIRVGEEEREFMRNFLAIKYYWSELA